LGTMWESRRVCKERRFWEELELALERVVDEGEDGEVLAAHQLLHGLQQRRLLDELGELGVVGLQEGNEDGVGVDLGRMGN
jgi:hypothetical protein